MSDWCPDCGGFPPKRGCVTCGLRRRPVGGPCVCRWTVQGYRANSLACTFPHAEREPSVSERQHYQQQPEDRTIECLCRGQTSACSYHYPDCVRGVRRATDREWLAVQEAHAVAAEARIAAALAIVERARAEASDPFSSEDRSYAWGRESAEAVKRVAGALEAVLRG